MFELNIYMKWIIFWTADKDMKVNIILAVEWKTKAVEKKEPEKIQAWIVNDALSFSRQKLGHWSTETKSVSGFFVLNWRRKTISWETRLFSQSMCACSFCILLRFWNLNFWQLIYTYKRRPHYIKAKSRIAKKTCIGLMFKSHAELTRNLA